MSIPKRHHYVPQFVLERFTAEDQLLYVLDKRRTAVFRSGVANAFVKSNLNTFVRKDGTRDVALEQFYSRLESEAAAVTRQVIESARNRQLPRLSQNQRQVWDTFFYHQHKRAPDSFSRLGIDVEFGDQLEIFIREYEKRVRPLSDMEKEELRSPAGQASIRQRALVKARSRPANEVLEVLSKRGIAIGIISGDSKSFIIGDHPLARMGLTGRLDHSQTEVWLPIASDVAITPWGAAGHEQLISLNVTSIRRINEIIFQQSNTVAARSDRLLRSLAALR